MGRNYGGGVWGDDRGSGDGRHIRRLEIRLARHLGSLSHRDPHRFICHLLHNNHLRRVAGAAAGNRPRPFTSGCSTDVRGGRLLLQFPRHDLPAAECDSDCPRRFGFRHGGRLATRSGRQPDGHHRHVYRRHNRSFGPDGLGLRPVAHGLPGPLHSFSGHRRFPRRHRLPAAHRRRRLRDRRARHHLDARTPAGIGNAAFMAPLGADGRRHRHRGALDPQRSAAAAGPSAGARRLLCHPLCGGHEPAAG